MKDTGFKSLFITYDGLTDPLGQSQILPYIIGLANTGIKFTILSSEKRDRYEQRKEVIQRICNENDIEWVPLFFHRTPPVLSKYYDFYQLRTTAKRLYLKERFDVIHCRSYLAAEIGRELKHKFGCRYLFDMRGFWVDERVDGGLWDTKRFFFRYAYQAYKKKEANLIADADHIISLTEAGKIEIESWKSYRKSTPITVVPCSADLDLFTLTDDVQKAEARKRIGVGEDEFVLSYLGSLGTWYLLDEMLLLFRYIKEQNSRSKFLILTPDNPELVYEKAQSLGLGKADFIVSFAERKDVPRLIKASDVSVSFIKPAYSKIASSPTKLGELLAMGIPVICNSIGDVEMILKKSGGGTLINEFTQESYLDTIRQITGLTTRNKEQIRANIESYYSLTNAVETYQKVYLQLLN